VPVIEPDLNALLGVGLLNDDVGRVVLVHVEGCDDDGRLDRVDGKKAYRPARSADTHSKYILATVPPENPQSYAFWLLIVVKICNDESLPETLAGDVTTIRLGRWRTDAPMLRKKAARCQKQRQEADLEETTLH
jgi:hypothetical protein